MKTQMNYRNLAALGSLILSSTLAHAQSVGIAPMFEVGGGMESAVSQGGSINVLLRVAGGIGLGGTHCDVLDVVCMPRNSQMIVATIDAAAALDPNATGAQMLQYMNIRFTPVSIPPSPQTTVETEERWARYGRDVGFHVDVLPARLQRDVRVNREADVWVSAVGIDARLQAFPETFFGFFVQAAADVLGYRYVNQQDLPGGAELHGLHAGHARVEAGVTFLLDQAVVIRLSGGAEGSAGVASRGGAVAIADLELFSQLSVSLTRIIEVYARISTNQRWLEGADVSSHRSVEQFMAGLTLRFY